MSVLVRNYEKEFEEIYSKDEIDEKLKTAGVDDGSVTTEKLANQSVTSAKLGYSSVSTNHLQNEAVTIDKLGNLSVSSDKIFPNAILASHLATDAIFEVKNYIGDGSTDDRTINCGFRPRLVLVRALAWGADGLGEDADGDIIHVVFAISFSTQAEEYEPAIEFTSAKDTLDKFAMKSNIQPKIVDNGFEVNYELNVAGVQYEYIVFR